jgi:hypothetical protein
MIPSGNQYSLVGQEGGRMQIAGRDQGIGWGEQVGGAQIQFGGGAITAPTGEQQRAAPSLGG